MLESGAKKLVPAFVTFRLMNQANKKAKPKLFKKSGLQSLSCINYLAQSDGFSILALIDSSIKINAMQPSLVTILDFSIFKINIWIQKIDSNMVKTCGIVIVRFQINNKNKNSCFFEETFLFADISMYIAFRISFLFLSNIKVNFMN